MKRTPRDEAPYGDLLMPPGFRALYDHALDTRHIDVVIHAGTEHEGTFVTEWCPDGHDPYVVITVLNALSNIDDIEDLITLAHELGHHESWGRCDGSDDFEEFMAHHAMKIREKPEEYESCWRLALMHEEVRAWRYGRAILAAVVPTFTGWSAFDAHERDRLAGYLHGLMLAPDPDRVWLPRVDR